MAALRRSRFPTSSGQRRKTSWAIGPNIGADGAIQTITGSSAVLATTGGNFNFDGDTLVRTRGELNLFLTVANASKDGFHGAFGIAIVSAAAFVAGAASVPTPLTEDNWDGWLYHRFFSCFSGGVIAAATAAQEESQVNNSAAAVRVEVDSKAMRKVATDMTIFACFESVEVGTAQMAWSFNSRLLLKLP